MAMDSKQINARDAKKGNYVIFDDVVCKVIDNKISKPGKHLLLYIAYLLFHTFFYHYYQM